MTIDDLELNDVEGAVALASELAAKDSLDPDTMQMMLQMQVEPGLMDKLLTALEEKGIEAKVPKRPPRKGRR